MQRRWLALQAMAGFKLTEEDFRVAVQSGNIEKVRAFLAEQKSSDIQRIINDNSVFTTKAFGDLGDVRSGVRILNPSLIDAISGGHFEIAQLLIDRGANVNVVSEAGLTPLKVAMKWMVEQGDGRYLDALFTAPRTLIDVNYIARYSELSPLMSAVRSGARAQDPKIKRNVLQLIDKLFEQKADATYQNSDRISALYLATKYGDVELVKKLLDNNANLDAIIDSEGNTLINYALQQFTRPSASNLGMEPEDVSEEDIENYKIKIWPCIQELITRGANLDIANHRGQSARTMLDAIRQEHKADSDARIQQSPVHAMEQANPMVQRLQKIPDFDDSTIPEEFLCGITFTIMHQPVTTVSTGRTGLEKIEHHYELAAIRKYYDDSRSKGSPEPHTRRPMTESELIIDTDLQNKIKAFVQEQEDNYAKKLSQSSSEVQSQSSAPKKLQP